MKRTTFLVDLDTKLCTFCLSNNFIFSFYAREEI